MGPCTRITARLVNSRDRRILDIETRCGRAGKEYAPQPHEDNPRAVPDWPCAGPNSTTHKLWAAAAASSVESRTATDPAGSCVPHAVVTALDKTV